MRKAIKSILSITMLLLVLLMVVLVSYNTHQHFGEHDICIKCELLKNISDFILLFLILSATLALVPHIVSLLAFILTSYRGTVLTPIKLRDKLSI